MRCCRHSFWACRGAEIAVKLKSHDYEFAMLDFVGLWALFALQLVRFGRLNWWRLAPLASEGEKPTRTS